MEQLAPEYPLGGNLTIYEVTERKPQLASWLEEAADRLEIDLAGIEQIDAAGVQLLALLKQESLRQQKTLCLRNHSAVVLAQFEKLNVAGFFGDPLILLA